MDGRRLFKQIMICSLLFLLLGPAGRHGKAIEAYDRDPTVKPRLLWPPPGQKVKCPVIRDTGVSSVDEEKNGSNGGAKRLKLKGQQEYILFDIDLSFLRGKLITGALFHMRSASPRNAPLARLGVSTIASEWIEGTSKGLQPQKGSSCFEQAGYQEREWAYPGSTIVDVTFGRGHTIWKFADCTPPDPRGWQTCAVDPDVVAARVAGLSHGFFLSDEVGSVWSLKKGRFKFTYFPNRFSYSREGYDSVPWLEVWMNGTDSIPPEPVTSFEVDIEGFPSGEALLRWKTPADRGGGKTLGFVVTFEKGEEENEIPRYLIPVAGSPGEEVRMHLQDLLFEAGESIPLTIRPVDSAGNIGPPITSTIQVSSIPRVLDLPEVDIKPFLPCTSLPQVGGLKVAVVDLLDKIDPTTGKMIPPRKEGYKGGNHIYSAKKRQIRLYSARNETVSFQLNLEGRARNISVDYKFDQNPNLKPKVFQFAHVNVLDDRGKVIAVLPDPLIPLTDTCSIPSTAGQVYIRDQKNLSLICEVYIPHTETPGEKKGKVKISVGSASLELDVDLEIWNFTLPNKLSFVPEMNVYWAISPYKGYEYYRLAHEHRTCLNRLPYGWDGIPSFAPKWKGNDFDWSEWDLKVGPLLDGSAFENLPRKNEPVDVFYLPFNENWPVSIFQNYKPSFWADEAFAPRYKENLKRAFAAFARHCEKKRWHNTVFQFYLNNKVYYRAEFPRSSAPWIFDEPVNTQDFWALRWYGILWHLAIEPVRRDVRMWYRSDISYGQFGRNILWRVTDVEYLGENDAQKTRMKHDEQLLGKRSYFAEYGTANRIETPNTQPTLWCLSAWSKGAIGVLPWQTLGGENCWKFAEQTALFYPHTEGPKSSVRLKAFTRGQQDVEYLTLFCQVYKKPRHAVVGWLKQMIALDRIFYRSLEAEVGNPKLDSPDPTILWSIRYRVGKRISEKGPKYRHALVDWEIPAWDIQKLPDIGYVLVAPQIQSYKPQCDNFRPQ